jgi:hypothetical protein
MFLLTFASCSREEQPETTRAVFSHPALGTRTQKFSLASSVSHSLHVSAFNEQHTRTLSCYGLWVRVPKELPLMFLLTFASCSREEQPETTCAVLSHLALGTRTQKFSLASSVSHSLHVSASSTHGPSLVMDFGYAYPKIPAGLISVSLSACVCE